VRGTLLALALLLLAGPAARRAAAQAGAPLTLAAGGRTPYLVSLDPHASPTARFAAAELSRYLQRMSGADFRVVESAGDASSPAARCGPGPPCSPLIRLATAPRPGDRGLTGDAYSIAVAGRDLLLTGGSDRALLYSVYDLLARLGCQWLAPEFEYYRGAAEVVPRSDSLVYRPADPGVERPALAVRTLDVAQAASEDTATLRRIVEWMPKLRFNTLRFPLNHGGGGRARWDAWRAAIAPELEKRGLTIEVGGHGYQNFLNAEMEGGRLFEEHPDWFGRDEECRPSRAHAVVFDTSNPDAVEYLIGNVVAYLRGHPEVDVFDSWPPDGARWSECGSHPPDGDPAQRQARLVGRLEETLRRERLPVRVEMIAYADALLPPSGVTLPRDVYVEFCPIDQSFDVQIFDPASAGNARYVAALREWRRRFPGSIGVYTYYRKYAWRSLPIVIPHYIARDLAWYAGVPVQGVSVYGEPADWYTYELNLLASGAAAWNPAVDVDSLVGRYLAARYGGAAEVARRAYSTLENVYRLRGSVPFSEQDTPAELDRARREIGERREALAGLRLGDPVIAADVRRLELMLEVADRDLEIQSARVRGAPQTEVDAKVRALVAFLADHRDDGVFLTHDDDIVRYTKHYTRESRITPLPDGPAAPR
jgi:hypothetical protein